LLLEQLILLQQWHDPAARVGLQRDGCWYVFRLLDPHLVQDSFGTEFIGERAHCHIAMRGGIHNDGMRLHSKAKGKWEAARASSATFECGAISLAFTVGKREVLLAIGLTLRLSLDFLADLVHGVEVLRRQVCYHVGVIFILPRDSEACMAGL